MSDLALLSTSGRIATLTINRPDSRNAMSIDLLQALHARLDELKSKSDVSVLIFTGAGKSFCAGMDLKAVLSSKPLPEGGVGEGSPHNSHAGQEVPGVGYVSAFRKLDPPPREQQTYDRAHILRKNCTGPEWALWGALRSHGLSGLKFRRQHPFGPFILDFVCLEAGLVVEVDGRTHFNEEAASKDARRTDYLTGHGLYVLRVSNDAVAQNLNEVVRRIAEVACARLGSLRKPLPEGGVGEGSPDSSHAGQSIPVTGLGDISASNPAYTLLSLLADLCLKLRRLPMVVLGKINGAAIGGGCGLACVCDIAITHADSKMGFPEVDLGVCPAVVAPWLVRRIGAGCARQILLSGGLMSGQQAFEAGMVTKVVPTAADLDAAVDELAARLAAGGPHALRATKDLLNQLDGSLDADLSRRGAELSARVLALPEARAMLEAKFAGR